MFKLLKIIFYSALFIFITIGAVYSYDQLNFGQRTASFFRIALSGERSFTRGRNTARYRNFNPDSTFFRNRRSERTRNLSRARNIIPDSIFTRIRNFSQDRNLAQGRNFNPDSAFAQRRPPMERNNESEVRPDSRFRGDIRPDDRRNNRRGFRRRNDVALEDVTYYGFILAFSVMITCFLNMAVRKTHRLRHKWH